jgi:hypothetical protein
MNESILQQALAQACPGSGLIFQPIFQDYILHLYLNRPVEIVVEYEALAERIHALVISLEFPELEGLWLYCRILGATQPEWDRFLSMAPIAEQKSTHSIDEVGQDLSESSASLHEQFEEVTLEISTDEGLETTPTVTEASLLDLEGVSAVQENEQPGIDNILLADVEPDLILKQYCFTRNRALLTSEVLPPAPVVAQLILDFHALSAADKKVILPCLEQLFRASSPVAVEQFSDAARTWFITLEQLSGQDSRKAAIWLSRYCYDSKTTLSAVQSVLNPQLAVSCNEDHAVSEIAEQNRHNPSESNQSAPSQYQSVRTNASYRSQARASQRGASQSSTRPPKFVWQTFLIPIAWMLFTLCVVSWNVQASSGMGAIANFCKSASGDQGYCKLAGQMVSLKILESFTTFNQSFTPVAKETAIQDCAQNSQSSEKRVDAKLSLATKSPRSEEIFPGVLVVDLQPQQTQSKVRNACVYTQVMAESAGEEGESAPSSSTYVPELLEQAEIPINWPRTPFKNKTTIGALEQTMTVHSTFSALGTNTMFTAVGILGVMFCRLGIQVGSLNSLYQAAFLTGMGETLLGLMPFPLFMRWKVLLALGIASIFVKDFEINWSRGYWVLSLSVFLLILIRLLLDWAFFAAIFTFI